MDLDELMPMSRGMKVINRSEAWARRELKAKRVAGEKIGRDWWMYKTEVKRLSELYPVTPMPYYDRSSPE